MEPRRLMNEHETYKCKMCGFRSRNENNFKYHLVEHVNQSVPSDSGESDEDEIKDQDQEKLSISYSIGEDYDDDGKLINPDSEIDSE